MTQQELIRRLKEYLPQTRSFQKIEHVYLFGSYSRNEQTDASDVDLLISFKSDSKADLFDLVRVQIDVEEKLGRKVDVGSKLSKYVEPYVTKDLIQIV